MKKKTLIRVLIISAVLLLLVGAVAIAIVATNSAAKSAELVELEIAGANLSFSDSVYIKYAVSYANVPAEDISLLVWTEPQSSYVKGNETVALSTVGTETVDGVECLIFNYTGLAAKQMTDNVYAVAYAKVGGVDCYSAPKKYSILQYAYNKMGKTGTKTEDAKLITLLEDMLNYGALAQKYTNYKTDTLATDSFSQIKLAGGTLSDGFNFGLYKVGTKVNVTAPSSSDGMTFVGWRNSTGSLVSTSTSYTVTVGASNEVYSAVYTGAAGKNLEYVPGLDGSSYSVIGIGSCTDANVKIPATIGEKAVTQMSDGAFKSCTGIRSVSITKEITYIGAEVFSGCTGLTSIRYAGSESGWNKITKDANWSNGMGKITISCEESDADWELGGVPLG